MRGAHEGTNTSAQRAVGQRPPKPRLKTCEMSLRLFHTAADPTAAPRSEWTPAQAAEFAARRDFLLLQQLSKDRRALAAACAAEVPAAGSSSPLELLRGLQWAGLGDRQAVAVA